MDPSNSAPPLLSAPFGPIAARCDQIQPVLIWSLPPQTVHRALYAGGSVADGAKPRRVFQRLFAGFGSLCLPPFGLCYSAVFTSASAPNFFSPFVLDPLSGDAVFES